MIDKRTIIANVLVALWGARLAIHIGRRHTQEDYRYIAMRERWMKKGKLTYYFNSFMYIFMLQGLFSLLVNASALYISAYSPIVASVSPNTSALMWTDYLGMAVSATGLLTETVADH